MKLSKWQNPSDSDFSQRAQIDQSGKTDQHGKHDHPLIFGCLSLPKTHLVIWDTPPRHANASAECLNLAVEDTKKLWHFSRTSQFGMTAWNWSVAERFYRLLTRATPRRGEEKQELMRNSNGMTIRVITIRRNITHSFPGGKQCSC